jgi:hypothetical protein
MHPTITEGTILIQEGTLIPACLDFQGEARSSGWMSVRNLDRGQLETQIDKAGWVVFSVTGEIRRTVVGFNKQKALFTAVRRVITSQQLQNCNCLEIAEVTVASFLNMHYVTVTAHSRHIQQRLGVPAPIKLRLWNGASDEARGSGGCMPAQQQVLNEFADLHELIQP